MTTCHTRLASSRQTGFTLIEVMIVVAIIAILSSIAYPSYRDYVTRGNIPTATSALAAKQVQMEQFFQDKRTYVGGDTAATIGAGMGCVSDTTGKYFNFSCAGGDAPSATAYKISAIGKGSMAGFTFTIDQSGTKTTGAVPSGWSQPNPNTCWVTSKGGAC